MPIQNLDELLTGTKLTSPSVGTPDPSKLIESTEESSTLGAAFRQENIVGSAIEYFGAVDVQAPTEFDANPYIPEQYKADAMDYIRAQSTEDVDAITQYKDQQLKDRETLSKGGLNSMISTLVATMADPTILIPGGVAFKTAKTGLRAVQSAAASSALVTGATAIQETGLQATQTERTLDESAMNIAVAGLFAGVLGGALGAMNPIQRSAAQATYGNEMGKTFTGAFQPGGAVMIKNGEFVGNVNPGLVQKDHLSKVNEHIVKVATGGHFGQFLMSPIARGLVAGEKFPTLFALTDKAFNHNFQIERSSKQIGEATMESKLLYDMATATTDLRKVEELYKNYSKTTSSMQAAVGAIRKKHMSFTDFETELAKAQRRGDKHQVPEIQQAAEQLRKSKEPFVQELVKRGLLDTQGLGDTAASHFTRSYNVPKIVAEREQFSSTLFESFKVQRAQLKGQEAELLLAKEKLTKLETLTEEQSKELKHIETQLKHANATDAQLRGSVSKTIDNIIGFGDKRIQAMDMMDGLMGSTPKSRLGKERVLRVSDIELEPWLHHNSFQEHQSFISTASSVIHAQDMLKSMGFESMNDVRKAIKAEGDALMAKATTEKEKLKIYKETQDAITNANDAMNIMLGRYGQDGLGSDLLRTLRTYQNVRLLGGLVISQMTDLAMPIFIHGVGKTLTDGWLPELAKWVGANDLRKMGDQNLKDLGIGIQAASSSVLQAMAEHDFRAGRQIGKGEKALLGVSKVFGNLSLANYWDDTVRKMAGHMAASHLIRDIDASIAGTLTEKELKFLGTYRIPQQYHAMILDNYKRFGGMEEGSPMTNFHLWDKEAQRVFGQAVRMVTDSTIIRPSRGDNPVIFQGSELHKTLGHLTSFSAAATNKILISGLQRADKEAMSGVVGLLTMGAIVGILKDVINGKEPDLSPENLILQGFNRSGVAGYIGTTALNWATGESRYAGQKTVTAIYGPTAGLINSAGQVGKQIAESIVDGENHVDEQMALSLLPFNNLFYIQTMAKQISGDKK